MAELKKITTVEGITEYRLDNGLQVLLFPDTSKPTVTVNVTYRVGSRHEGRGEAGMAHLLEHMVFKGTPTYPNIWGALEDHGANFNGTTWVDRTNYFETLNSSDENIEFALHMEADRMINSLIDAEELAREMTVVRNEFEQGENSPSSVLSERMMSAAYLWHNYGKSTIGNRSDIERVPVENLRRFYQKYYQPDNATLIVAGNFQPEKVLPIIQREFGKIPRPERELDSTYTEEPPQDGPRHVELRRVGDVAVAGVLYHIPAGAHADFAAIEILEDVFTSQPSGRLYRQMVVPGMASSVSGAAFSWAEPGVIQFSAEIAADHSPETALNFMTNILETTGIKRITDEEVDRSKTRILKRLKLGMRDTGRVGVRLSEYIAQGDWRLMFVHRDRLEQVTTADVQRVAEKYLVTSNRTTGLFLPTKEPQRIAIPTTPDIQTVVEGYTGSQEMQAGEELQPDVAFIEQRVIREMLPSGIKVAFLPIRKRGGGAWFSAQLRYGNETSLKDKATEIDLMPMLLMRGTKKRSFQELRDEIDRLESDISVGSFGRMGGGGLGVLPISIQSDRQNLADAIRLAGEVVKEPAFAEEEFKVVASMVSSMMEQSRTDPRALGMIELQRKLSPWPEDSIHYVRSIEESIQSIKSVSLDAIRDLHQQQVGAAEMYVAVLGDFDVDEIRNVINEVFAGWEAKTPVERITEPFIQPVQAALKIETPDKEMAIIGMGTSLAVRDDDPHYPALLIADYVFGQSSKSRLLNRLRHEGGLSYGAGSMLRASRWEPNASFIAFGICAPQNAAEALDAIRAEFQSWVQHGLTPEELAESQKSYALKFKSRLANEQSLISELVGGLESNRTLEFKEDQIRQIQALSVEQLRNVLQQVFSGAQIVEMMAGDFARVAEAEQAAGSGSTDRAALTK